MSNFIKDFYLLHGHSNKVPKPQEWYYKRDDETEGNRFVPIYCWIACCVGSNHLKSSWFVQCYLLHQYMMCAGRILDKFKLLWITFIMYDCIFLAFLLLLFLLLKWILCFGFSYKYKTKTYLLLFIGWLKFSRKEAQLF